MTEAGSSERGAKVRFPPPLVYVIWTLVGVGMQYGVVPLRVPTGRTISAIAGLLMVAAGFAVAVSARRHFTRTGQSPAPWTPSPELILQGPYTFTRNPMYLGLTIVQIGVGVGFNNLWISLLALLSLATTHVVAVLPEERYLSEKFGDSYRTYLTRVRRYL